MALAYVARSPAGPGWSLNGPASSNADALCQQLAVVRGIAQQQLGRLGPLEVEVGRVLPREADAAVDLDVLGRRVEVGLRAVRLGQRRHHGELVGVLGRSPGGVV